MAEKYVMVSNSTLLALMSDDDRKNARFIYEHKQHLGTVAMIELAYMMGKCSALVLNPEDKTKPT